MQVMAKCEGRYDRVKRKEKKRSRPSDPFPVTAYPWQIPHHDSTVQAPSGWPSLVHASLGAQGNRTRARWHVTFVDIVVAHAWQRIAILWANITKTSKQTWLVEVSVYRTWENVHVFGGVVTHLGMRSINNAEMSMGVVLVLVAGVEGCTLYHGLWSGSATSVYNSFSLNVLL